MASSALSAVHGLAAAARQAVAAAAAAVADPEVGPDAVVAADRVESGAATAVVTDAKDGLPVAATSVHAKAAISSRT